MAVCFISEYPSGGNFGNHAGQIVQEPEITSQTIAIGGSSTQSSAFSPNTRIIRVHVDAACSIQIGANPTASATTKRLAANQTEYFYVQGGHKLAVITNA